MDLETITKKLLENRGISSPDQINEFFNPTHPQNLISPFDSRQAIQIIKSHIKKNNKIAIYGDYDVDGICSTAILWESLYLGYKNVFPHIPHRETEGYGLSTKGIDRCLEQGAKLIIAVDNGITAHQEIEYCKELGCDIIVIDHHEPGLVIPKPNVLIHSTQTCAAGLVWFFSRDYLNSPYNEHLSLVSIAVVCDIVPLVGINRSFVKHGLTELNKTTRPGLLALLHEAGIYKSPLNLNTYEVGFIIGPRLNAMGRLEHAIDSLRLICTNDSKRAEELALTLNRTNKSRQDITTSSIEHAIANVDLSQQILIVDNENYPQGIIGLIAARLTEKYYRPSIAISIGTDVSKASARSIPGFHITDHIRNVSSLLVNAGGHAMAAGFTLKTSRLKELKQALSSVQIDPQLLVRQTRVDLEIPLDRIDYNLWDEITKFAPFGLSNPTPTFKTRHVNVDLTKKVGKNMQHIKLVMGDLEAMAFNVSDIPLNPVDLVYSIDENTWNGTSKLQLMVKDIKSSL